MKLESRIEDLSREGERGALPCRCAAAARVALRASGFAGYALAPASSGTAGGEG